MSSHVSLMHAARSGNDVEELVSLPTVLVVEDDAVIREMLTELLQTVGYVVVAAVDGREALAHAADATPDLVLTDLQMPNMDGLQLAAALRAEPATSAVPIILYSAADQEPDGRGALFDSYVGKPFHLLNLLTRVQEMCMTACEAPAYAAS